MKPELCNGCPLFTEGEGYSEGEGPEDATTLLIGEALGAEEAKQGRPFVGGAGRVLNNLLHKAGVRRSGLYITNVVCCRPPRNRTPSEAEMRECVRRHKLKDVCHNFNFVVLMGNTALTAITGKTRISKWRGSVFEHEGIKLMPTFHPAAIMRQQEMIPVAVADLKKIGREGWTEEYTAPKMDYELEAHVGHYSDVMVIAARQKEAFAFDVETSSLEPRLGSVTLLGLCACAGRSHVFKDLVGCQSLFESGLTKIGHNIMFDIRHMEANGVPVARPWFDTMIAHHLVLSDVPNDLGFVSSLYTRIPYWKDEMKQNLALYNAKDVDATFRIYETLAPEIEQKGMTRVFDTSMNVMPVLAEMKEAGVRVNTKLQLKWKVALERRIQKLEAMLKKGVGDSIFNWKSSKQLIELLYNKMKLPRVYSKYSQQPTANEEALKELKERTSSPIIPLLLSLRKLNKLSSTYFTPPEEASVGRVHSEYLLHGTSTGRLASRGPNLQNVPKGPARSIYIPEDGMMFTQADYSQIEMRIMAVLAGEQSLLDAFDAGLDIHTVTASKVYHVNQSEVTDKQRFRAKMIVYGLSYGRGARSMAREHKTSISVQQHFIDEYFSQYPHIKLWRQDIVGEASKNGYLVNSYGRRRYFFGPGTIPKVYNFLPQSIAADVLLESLVRLHQELPKNTRMVLTVHDSVLVEHPPEMEKRVAECLRDVMEKSIDVLDNYVVPIDITSGKTWEECK